MKTMTLFLVPAMTDILGDLARHFAGSAADLAVWIGASLLFGALLNAWWVPRA